MSIYDKIEKWYKIYHNKRPSLHNNAILQRGETIRRERRMKRIAFIEIMSFKLGNRNYVKYYIENPQEKLDRVFNESFFEETFNKTKTINRLEKMVSLSMVSIRTASAFLAIIYPNYYGIIDKFAIKAVNSLNKLDKKINIKSLKMNDFWRYTKAIRDFASKTTLRPKEVDCALQTLGFYLANQRKIIKYKLPEEYFQV